MKKIFIVLLLLISLSACTGLNDTAKSSNASEDKPFITETASNAVITESTVETAASGSAATEPNQESAVSDIAGKNNYFGFADETGKLIIIPSAGIPDGAVNPQDIGYAIGDNGSLMEVGYMKRQEEGKDDNGRMTMYNFANIEGYVFEVKSNAVIPNNTYYLVSKAEFSPDSLIKTSVQDKSKAAADIISKIEEDRQRKVKNAWILALFESDKQVCLVEFESEKTAMLASIVLVQPSGISYKDYPATFDGGSAWRVDDGGEIRPEMFDTLFIARSNQEIYIGITWSGAEGENDFILKAKGANLDEVGNKAGRYWSPA